MSVGYSLRRNTMVRRIWWLTIVSLLAIWSLFPSSHVGAAASGKLEIFSWWTAGGEAEGLKGMFTAYQKAYPSVEIVNATVAGGAGTNAKAVLATRLTGGDPPDSFQVHAGLEVQKYDPPKYLEPLSGLFKSEGWEKVFPSGLLDLLRYQGNYWSVPVNIHRANVMWISKKVFSSNYLTPAKTFDEFFTLADTLKAKGIVPFVLGDKEGWEAGHAFEAVLIGTLGADGYRGLWTGKTAMEIMGDWEDGWFQSKNFTGYGWASPPGNAGVFDALSDSFAMPKASRNRANAQNWLKVSGSKAGQEAFNPKKGSICARTDCNQMLFNAYLQSSAKDWAKDALVPSVIHGAAAFESWATKYKDAMALFVTSGDVAKTQAALQAACKDAGVCK